MLHMKELQDVSPDFVFLNDEESMLRATHDVVIVHIHSNSGTV